MRVENEALNPLDSVAESLGGTIRLQPPNDRTPVWNSRAFELVRETGRKVRAVRWTRGDDLVITLQWFFEEAGGRWSPLNTPPLPGGF